MNPNHPQLQVAACRSCHTPDPQLSEDALAGGHSRQCGRCGQQWTAARLATADAFAAWAQARTEAAALRSAA